MPKISIIVPVYKVEQYLRRCLDSIVKQTFTDWECILVDDGSPDNSGKICDEYAEKDRRFRVFHQVNAGVSAARNKGLDEAKGEWNTFVDSDDWIENEMFAELYQCALQNQAEVVVSGCTLTNDLRKGNIFLPQLGWLNMPKDFKWYIQGPCAKLFSRTILYEYNIQFPEGITMAEDLYFTFKVYFNVNKIYGLNKSYYNYFQNEMSAMHNFNFKKIDDEVRVVNMMSTEIKSDNIEWFSFVNDKKQLAKKRYIFDLKTPNFNLWRTTFPEVSWNFKHNSGRMILLMILINLHLDFCCKIYCQLFLKP